MNLTEIIKRILRIAQREVKLFSHRPLCLFCAIIAPIFCAIFFTSLMYEGLPTDLPAGVVDEDNTKTTRQIIRTLDALENTDIVAEYSNFSEAREAMQHGKIYAFFYIPKGTTEKAISSRQPQISFYTNETYFVAASLLMRDLRLSSELVGLAITRQTLYAKGATERQAMGIIQPIAVEAHPLKNPYLNYSVYLNNIIVPGIFFLLVMLITAYSIGEEWKRNTQKEWYEMGGRSSVVALIGKLLPQTLLFWLIMIFIDVYMYKYMAFPCNCGISHMILAGMLTVLASQGFSVFIFGILPGQLRLAMSTCSLWGVISFSISGMSFPISAMAQPLQLASELFPLRHYFLIYVNQALDGYSIYYVWCSVTALIIFAMLPMTVLWRYRSAIFSKKYVP